MPDSASRSSLKVPLAARKVATRAQARELGLLIEGGSFVRGAGPFKNIWQHSASAVGIPDERVQAMGRAGWLHLEDGNAVLTPAGRREVRP